ncbi:MAG: hypothetical protein HY924_07050 [Elusimicrobia bacterium]|nr:hypothetical protein [Elusimicrobiota bacterium]
MRRPGRAGLVFLRRQVVRAAPGWRLEDVTFSDERLEFALVRGSRRLFFEAVPAGQGAAACLFSSKTLGLNLRGGETAVAQSGGRAQALFRCLARLGFGGLLAKLSEDALDYVDCGGTRPATRLERYFRLADHSPDWWKFVYPKNDFLDQEVRLGRRCVKVNHGSWECRYNTVEHDLAGLRYFADSSEADPGGVSDVQTGVDDRDVTGGGSLRRLERSLEAALTDLRPDCVQVNSTCLPELLGEDPRPLIARAEKRHGVPIYWTSKTRDSGRSVTDIVRSMLGKVRFRPRRDPAKVVLAGGGSAGSRLEAVRLLSGLGLEVAGFVYPEVALASLPGIESCSALVWVDPAGWERISDEPFLETGFSVVRCHPPFGLARTEAWLDRIRAVLGLRGGWSLAGEARRTLDRVRPECRKWRAAVIGDAADVGMLSSGAPFPGFSVTGLLEEMGFQTRTFVLARAGRALGGRGPVRTFGSRRELDALLREETDLAFTHFNHDPRLESCGVAGFCETAFSVGVAGLLEGGMRLAGSAASRPFPAHRGFLRAWT